MTLYKTSVKMVNMRMVRLTYRVTPYLIISGAQASEYARFKCENKSTVRRIKNNKHSNKQTMSIRSF